MKAPIFCVTVFTLLSLTTAAKIFKPTKIYPLSNLPPKYPIDGFPEAPDFVLPGTTASAHVADIVGLIYIPLNDTHGTICSASTINKRWIVTSAHCLKNADKKTAKVYLPNPSEKRYEFFGMKIILRHKNFVSDSSAADIGMAKLRRFNRNVPFSRPKIHGSVDNANRPGAVRVLPRFRTPANKSPSLMQSQQVTRDKLCKPKGTTDGSFLCTNAEKDAKNSGAGRADSGAPLIGPQQSHHRVVAVMGLYAGSSNNVVSDVSRINYFVIVARFKSDMAAARFGDLTNWVEL